MRIAASDRADAEPRPHPDLFDRIAAGLVAAAIAAIDLIAREPDYAALPLKKAKAFTRAAGLPEAASPIVPLMIGDPDKTLAASRRLEDEGFLVIAIRPPTVPAGTARLRFTFCAAHPDAEIARLAKAVRAHLS